MNRQDKIRTVAVVALFAAFAAVRFWRLADSCLWFDEIFSVHAASLPWSQILKFVAADLIHPPLFYLLLKLWTSIGGESVIWVRLFPFFASVAGLVPLYFLFRDLKLRTSQTVIALLFLAVNGGLIKYAQEVRMYSLVWLLGLFSVWLFVRFFYLGKNIWLLTLVNCLLVLTHYFGWFVIGAEVLAIVVLQRIKVRQILIMVGISFVVFAPWLATVVSVARNSGGLAQNIGWINAPGVRDLFNFGFDLVDPFYFQASSIDLASMYIFSVPILLIVFTAFLLYFADWKTRDETERARFVLLAILGVFPVVAAFAVSWILPYSIWGTRHLIAVFAPLAIVAAIAMTGIGVRLVRISLIALTSAAIAFAAVAHFTTPAPKFIWCGWESLASTIDSPGPVKIVAFEDVVAYDLWYALRSRPGVEIVKVNGLEGLEEDKAYFLPREFSGVRVAGDEALDGERFFVAFRDIIWNEKHPPLRQLRDKGYQIGEAKIFQAQGQTAFLVEVTR